MRVLIVEDEESILDTLKLNLELEDFEVVTAMGSTLQRVTPIVSNLYRPFRTFRFLLYK